MLNFMVICMLLVANLIFAYLLFRYVVSINLFSVIYEKIKGGIDGRNLLREAGRYAGKLKVRMNIAERVQLLLIDKSNISRFIPFFDARVLVVLMSLIFLVSIGPVNGLLNFLPSSFVVSLLFSFIPVFMLDIMARFNSELVRRKLPDYISILNRWCSVREDIFYAFEKAVDSGIGEPLVTFTRDMVIQVKRGIDPFEALDIMQMKVDHPQFADFVINVKQNIRYRGDLKKLLDNLESQFYRIEEEYNRRKISTYKDRMLTYFVMLGVLVTSYAFMKFSPQVEYFYFETMQGKTLLMLFCLAYAAGFYLSFGVMKFKH